MSASDSALLRACASAFTGRSIRLGRALHDEGHAHIEGADDNTVIIRVSGEDQVHAVGFSFSEVASRSRLQVQCDCAFFKEGFRCEHIYAGLLAIESSGLNMVAPHYLDDPLDLVVMREDLRLGKDHFFQAGEDEEEPPTIELDWRQQLTALRRTGSAELSNTQRALERGRSHNLRFILLPGQSEERQAVVVSVVKRLPAEASGGEPTEEPLAISEDSYNQVGDERDAHALALLGGCRSESEGVVAVPSAWSEVVLDALVSTGRFYVSAGESPISWDDPSPWEARLELRAEEDEAWRMEACFHREDQRVPVRDPSLVLSDGLMLLDNRLCHLAPSARGGWLRYLRRAGEIRIPLSDQAEAVRELCRIPGAPKLQLPGPWHFERQPVIPQIRFERPKPRHNEVLADVAFVYEGVALSANAQQTGYVDEFQHRVVLRDLPGEATALERLGELGLRSSPTPGRVEVDRPELDHVVRILTTEGWRVYAEGWQMRPIGTSRLSLSSEQDWFELSGEFDFDGIKVGLPELLSAIENRGYVELGDGTQGLLPESWLNQYEALARLGKKKGKALRFSSSQAMLIQALLEGRQEVSLTPSFRALQERLRQAQRLRPRKEPDSFEGELRAYQREGLGWLHYLSGLGLGGCLADDMGLGKTVQVLAWLEERRKSGEAKGPSLVVAPRSLIHNWNQEAARFVPALKVLDYTGGGRHEFAENIKDYDLILTTYGIVRRDTERLAAVTFDAVILDEAQAIKNASSQISRACRLLVGEHRLALSGTPVENRVGELWSLFEFLTPGLLGARAQFNRLTQSEQPEALKLVGKSLSPMILRRTKGQVLSELPEKTELTIYAELGDREREMYEELKRYYRETLGKQVAERGFDRVKIRVLEALLRLRQAACHPGLVDDKYKKTSSAKLELLTQQLEEITAEGHKALVFSQFVQLLDIFKQQLDASGTQYAYLDGRTQHREKEILRFSEDPECKLFLISLRAGGVGLNLTAADYVFILDPWWNPAVEAQAIDRAHRIGQVRPVFAYRIIARDTVEDKILALQEKKTRLVDAILGENQGGMRELTQEDLELLLK